jgi:hypothetical protein
MPATTSRIHIDPPRRETAGVHWEGELTTPSGQKHRIHYEFSTPDDRPYPAHARPFLLAFLLPAMSAGAPLELDLPIDSVTLNHLMEWQEAMAVWNPTTLKVVPIRAPIHSPPETPREPGALTAFSGGVDSNFTVWRNTRNPESAAYHIAPLQAGLMVHGFDIPLEQPPVFESAWNRSRKMLDAFGLKTYRMRTNLRSLDTLPGCFWDRNAHGIWLAAALSCYEPWFGHILIPSTYPYPKLILPWGTNPVTDYLFSSAATTFWHDGAAYSKLTKMQAIAHLPVVQQHLRVCWEGAQLDRNCGVCFKCLATRICFELSGQEQPEAFPGPYTIEQVSRIPVKNEQNDWLLRSMRSEAERQGKQDLARAITRALKRAKTKPPLRHIKKLIYHLEFKRK